MKKISIGVIVVLIVTAVFGYQIISSRTFQFFDGLIYRVSTNEKVVALTFDDGPGVNTDEVLAILREMDVKATFFLIGKELENNLEEGKKIAQAGHEIGNHSYSHNRMVFRLLPYVQNEIERTDQAIRETGYEGEILFRPPYGKKGVMLPYYLNQHNRKTILWDVEPNSYPEVDGKSEKIVAFAVEKTKPGSIILLHPMYKGREETVKSIRGIVENLRREGYSFKTVSELLTYSGK